MKGILPLYSFGLLALTSVGAAQTSSPRRTIELGANDSGKTFMVAKGTVIKLQLETNPSTGYSWKITKLPAGLKSLGSTTKSDAEAPPGAPSIITFSFSASKSVKGSLLLNYGRHYDADEKPAQTFRVVLRSR